MSAILTNRYWFARCVNVKIAGSDETWNDLSWQEVPAEKCKSDRKSSGYLLVVSVAMGLCAGFLLAALIVSGQ